MIFGVKNGYEKRLEIVGVGYQASIKGKAVNLRVGLANELVREIPTGLTVTCPDAFTVATPVLGWIVSFEESELDHVTVRPVSTFPPPQTVAVKLIVGTDASDTVGCSGATATESAG